MGKEEKNIKKSFLRYVIIASALCVLFLFLKKDNVIRWVQTGFTLHSQKKQIEMLEQENARLDKRIEDLTENKDSLERFARETYGFCRADEDVYLTDK